MEIRGVSVADSSNFPRNYDGESVNIVSPIKDQVTPIGFNVKDNTQSTNQKKENNQVSKFGTKELTPEEQKRVEQLKQTDAKVRAHEMAHLAAGGGIVRGGATFTYEIGPDGKQYAVAGEVKIDMSVNPDDPEGAIQKMQQVRRAALAPVDPSPQDRSVAQQASNIESQMRAKLLEEKTKQQNKLKSVYKTYLDFEQNSSHQSKETRNNNDIIPTPSVQSLKRKVDLLV
ncbi:MAG: SprA-related family protein [Ignavibacteria bacterium]|nr:SprA-related family protein [Ignavibacteria bacterium]